VTAVNYISRKNGGKIKMSVYVLDSKSGLPVRNAKVIVAEQKWTGSSYKLIKNE